MLVPRSWGGSGFVNKNQPIYTIAMSDYQIGDIFCGRYLNPESNSNVYWAAFYKGNN
jgi:hypothetical protein